MKSFFGGVLGALAVAAVALFVQSRAFSSNMPAAVQPVEALTIASTPQPLVNCGEGRVALPRQAVVGQQVVTQVDCVAVAPVVDAPAARPSMRTYAPRVVEPTYVRANYAATPVSYEPVRETAVRSGRSWKKSALIIGGSAAGGAGLGAILDGGHGAKKGAVVGGVAGVVYDIATRNK